MSDVRGYEPPGGDRHPVRARFLRALRYAVRRRRPARNPTLLRRGPGADPTLPRRGPGADPTLLRGPGAGPVGVRSRGPERGSVAIEVAVLAPAFIALIVLAGVAGRTAIAQEAVQSAAHDAARAASISRDAGTARSQALAAARSQLDWQRAHCVTAPALTFSGTVGGAAASFDEAFASGLGQPAAVTVRVDCTVSFTDIELSLLPAMPATRTISASFTSPLDSYRSRS